MSIFVKKSGLLATIQDPGRTGFRRVGINPNGAMDKLCVRSINILLGNTETEGVLEIFFPGPVLEFRENALIALGGADFGAVLDQKSVQNRRPIFVEQGQTLSFTEKKRGNCAYLAVRGGFRIKEWLNSKSTNLTAKIGGFGGRRLQKGDELELGSKNVFGKKRFNYFLSEKLFPDHQEVSTIRIIAGAENALLTGHSEEIFLSGEFKISADSNRMGFRLIGEPLCLFEEFELISTAVDFGTIQLLPDGQLIILMADHQTTGGYPRIGHVITADLPMLAQLGVNDRIMFKIVTQAEAERSLIEIEQKLNFLKIGCMFRNDF